MKTFLMILLLTFLSNGAAASDNDALKPDEASYNQAYQAKMEAHFNYVHKKSEAQKEYRDSLADMILKADKIEIFLLDFTMEDVKDPDADYFPVEPFQSGAHILAKKTVPPAELSAFKAAIAEVLLAKDDHTSGVFCHYPIHGIRVQRAGCLLLESSLCWTCNNYTLKYPDGPVIENMCQPTSTLRDLFDVFLPIPPVEAARFKKAMEEMNSKSNSKDGKKISPSKSKSSGPTKAR